MSTTSAPAPAATRLARLLRPAATTRGAWVSTEAAVRLDSGEVLQPAVVVALGEPPYDGVVDEPPLLVVEVAESLLARWYDAGARAVWGPCGDRAIVVSRGSRRTVSRSKQLSVPGHPWLRLPAAELLRPPTVDNVIHLPR